MDSAASAFRDRVKDVAAGSSARPRSQSSPARRVRRRRFMPTAPDALALVSQILTTLPDDEQDLGDASNFIPAPSFRRLPPPHYAVSMCCERDLTSSHLVCSAEGNEKRHPCC